MTSDCQKKALIFALVLGFAPGIFFTDSVFAWGMQPHEIIGEIADSFLSSKIRKKIKKEFNIKYLASIANWADNVKNDKKNEKAWHYTNVPKNAPVYDRLRDCPKNQCVTEKIGELTKVFLEKRHSMKDKREALKYLVHFVADIHQPLHVGNLEDRGGNDIPVRFQGEPTNLHAFWDHGLFPKKGEPSSDYAMRLECKVGPDDEFSLPDIPLAKWTNESRQLAVEHAYVTSFSDNGELTPEYVQSSRDITNRQLCRAGTRLANLLNQLLFDDN